MEVLAGVEVVGLGEVTPEVGEVGGSHHEPPPHLRRQVGALHRHAVHVLHLGVVEVAHPGCRREPGGVADEPGVSVVVGGARLARRRPTEVGGLPSAGVDHPLQGVGDLGGLLGAERRCALGREVLHQGPVGPLDPGDHDRRHAGALVGEGGVARGHVEHRDLPGAEDEGVQRRQVGRHPEAFGHGHHLLRSEVVHELGVGGVGRLLGGLQERGPTSAAPAGDLPRCAVGLDDVGEGHLRGGGEHRLHRVALVHGGGERERLERRSRLAARTAPLRAHGEVDLALGEVAAAHHGPHPSLVVDGHDGSLGVTGLVERGDDGVVGGPLQAQVDGGVHAVAEAVDLLVAVPLGQEASDVLDEVVAGGVGLGQGLVGPPLDLDPLCR